MFNKSASTSDDLGERAAEPLFRGRPAAQAPARDRPAAADAPPVPLSTLGEGLRMEGGVSGDIDLQLDGYVKGDIRVSRVVIGATATVEGSVKAEQIDVRGRVLGSVEGQVVRLYGTSHVEGDIHHGHLAIEGGAYFEGRCQPLRKAGASEPAAAAPAPPAKPTAVTPFPASSDVRETHSRANGVTAG